MPKKKNLTESQIEGAYEVVNGFNVPRDTGGRYNVGDIAFRKDFSEKEWSQISECLVKVEPELKEDEVVVFEVVK